MSIDYGEKEREFLESLAVDTGRDLAAWMAAIGTTGLTNRNEIIDWLRHQGFMFSKASWLERIFNNGGKPIYGERRAGRPAERARAEARPSTPSSPPAPGLASPRPPATAPAPQPIIETQPHPEPPVPAEPAAAAPPASAPQPMKPPEPPPAPKADLDATLAKAKAFRPLAAYVLAELRKVLPHAVTEPYANHVAIVLDGIEVAVLAISPKEIRLFVSALGIPFDAGLSPAKLPQGLIGMRLAPTHMIVLTDARAVTAELIERVCAACLKAAGKS